MVAPDAMQCQPLSRFCGSWCDLQKSATYIRLVATMLLLLRKQDFLQLQRKEQATGPKGCFRIPQSSDVLQQCGMLAENLSLLGGLQAE